TMLTADTHFPQGYICQKCRSDHDSVVENVLVCADCQANDFISLFKKQDFYKDTVIVVMGDHPRMDKVLPKDVAAYERTTYAVFVNCDDKAADSANRIYTQLDIMPTTLAAMGFKIEGNRLALGTNLFSDKATLAEELGFATLNSELGKGSEFLKELFAAE
ncbi:MAG: phosphoglycerol transferase, partial [Oscillospiraceae bacterium]|nr:phosphoglycerol transferase [Oscillospiraceae bacterium]